MRSFVSLICLLVPAVVNANANFGFGVFYNPGTTAPAVYRVGGSAQAWAPSLRYFFNSQTASGTVDVSAIYVLTGNEYVPGTWDVVVSDGNTPLASWSTTLAPNRWNRLAPPTPITIASSTQSYQTLDLRPRADAEIDILGLFKPFYEDVKFATVQLYGAPPRLGASEVGALNDAGQVVAVTAVASLVFEYAGQTDAFPPPGCDAGLPEVSGLPYTALIPVHVADGGSATQFFHRTASWNSRLTDFGVDVRNVTSSVSYLIRTQDAGVYASGELVDGALGYRFPECLTLLSPDVSDVSLTLSAGDGGSFDWMAYTVGEPVDACDPIARATWGGSTANGNSDPGLDFVMYAYDGPAPSGHRDRDQDGFGEAAVSYYCDLQTDAGLVTNGDDCDDTRADVHPDAGERCNGRDDDCNGVIDDEIALQADLCEEQRGVCSGSVHPLAFCSDGGWLSCGANEYPQSYEAREYLCDGLDNDCDGVVDDLDPSSAVGELCEAQLGVCAGSRARLSECSDGGWQRCDFYDYGPSYEEIESLCDGLDNDCDGVVDEGCFATPQPSAPDKRCGCTASGGELLAALALSRLVRRGRRSRA